MELNLKLNFQYSFKLNICEIAKQFVFLKFQEVQNCKFGKILNVYVINYFDTINGINCFLNAPGVLQCNAFYSPL